MSVYEQLQKWYCDQCDGDWEHDFGVKIGNIDNPGWSVLIDLEGTSLESIDFNAVEINYDHDLEWVRCWVEDKVFNGVGGPSQLGAILEVFIQFVRADNGS